jgi:metal-sulfur cluster biosynthetic enzyme
MAGAGASRLLHHRHPAGNQLIDEASPTVGRAPFPYRGDEALRAPITNALTRVVDPEVAMSIVDVGLIYDVTAEAGKVHVRMTMTSAACPVTDVVLGEVETELDRVLPSDWQIEVELCWEPPWTPERMSERARRFMQW